MPIKIPSELYNSWPYHTKGALALEWWKKPDEDRTVAVMKIGPELLGEIGDIFYFDPIRAKDLVVSHQGKYAHVCKRK